MSEHTHFENLEHEWDSKLKVNEGIEQPAQVNPQALERLKAGRQKLMPLNYYVDGILGGDTVILSKTITLVESTLTTHQALAQEIIAACLPYSGKALRLGITGVPGAGKSTFIESLGMFLCAQGKRIAVLAIDPSSQRSKGSILGDKTRMEQLALQKNAYIRPSASAGTLGGVARKTRESIVLCEAAGFDTIFVETVGVGQSETAVHSMVDFFLLILISGAGDELQGIKRGVMEMADGIIVNKADGDNIDKANRSQAELQSALRLFPLPESGLEPQAMIASALTNFNIESVWQMIYNHVDTIRKNGFLDKKRNRQNVQVLYDSIDETLKTNFYENQLVKTQLPLIEQQISSHKISAYVGASDLMALYLKNRE
ncbi:MAG: methylmalonyl Co-A mutase-associated GTPase MeaB [Lentimicrobiaceae bacterium]|jgi:LAO/AO transport system kinase|nr:methylmalonyl Co-A mutase-associated GTPase MeaB [Lentimicrobiaceae bacterium]